MTGNRKYYLGFTAASLRLTEMIRIESHVKESSIDSYEEIESPYLLINPAKKTTGTREFKELIKRLEKLTPKQKNILITGDYTSQQQMAFLAVCKSYALVRDFTVEVLREKVGVYDYSLSETDYLTFYRRKQDSHPELDTLAESTQKKLRQVVFKILEQAGFINDLNNMTIQPQILGLEVIEAIIDDNSNWFKVFLLGDNEINELKQRHG